MAGKEPYMKRIRQTIIGISVFIFIFSWRVFAQPVTRDHIEVELVSSTESVKPGLPFWVALRMNMEEGWHTYWQNPGDSGMTTKITWEPPQGAEVGPILWPYPETMSLPPL